MNAKQELETTYVNAIVATVMDKTNAEWDDVVFYSEVFLGLSRAQQKAWVEKMKKRYEDMLPKEGQHPALYDLGKAFLAWTHYENLYVGQQGILVDKTTGKCLDGACECHKKA